MALYYFIMIAGRLSLIWYSSLLMPLLWFGLISLSLSLVHCLPSIINNQSCASQCCRSQYDIQRLSWVRLSCSKDKRKDLICVSFSPFPFYPISPARTPLAVILNQAVSQSVKLSRAQCRFISVSHRKSVILQRVAIISSFMFACWSDAPTLSHVWLVRLRLTGFSSLPARLKSVF